ncbi:MAG: hypothetical protein R8M45_02275 [Ghiorsea sp.]
MNKHKLVELLYIKLIASIRNQKKSFLTQFSMDGIDYKFKHKLFVQGMMGCNLDPISPFNLEGLSRTIDSIYGVQSESGEELERGALLLAYSRLATLLESSPNHSLVKKLSAYQDTMKQQLDLHSAVV